MGKPCLTYRDTHDVIGVSAKMQSFRLFLCALSVCACAAVPADLTAPLESVSIEGTSAPAPVVMEIAGLQQGSSINTSAIEAAAAKLHERGLFAAVSYRYAAGPKKGYAVTLTLMDHENLVGAAIDVPGVDENEIWQWLATKFPAFQRRVPEAAPAQQYLAKQIEQHLEARQPMKVALETDLRTGELLVVFQPERLPRMRSVTFTGNRAVSSDDLGAAIRRVVEKEEYSDRKFAGALETNLRPIYEQYGLYRVRFLPARPEIADGGVSVAVAVDEGEPYRLGNVELAGDGLPRDAMLAAGKLPVGQVANWRKIQEGVWEMEKVVKRQGFLEALASPDRSYDDERHLLHLTVRLKKGPMFRFGQIAFHGLNAQLDAQARKLWLMKPGDPYDYAYGREFLEAFSRIVDFRRFRKYDINARKGAGDHVMDVDVVFEGQ